MDLKDKTKKRKLARRCIVGMLVVLALLVVLLYVQANREPGLYHPARLQGPQREESAVAFYNRLADFHNHAVDTKPFEWTISQQEIDAYVASLDEIVAMFPNQQPGQVREAMAEAQVRDPAVGLVDGQITLMIRWDPVGAVLSARLKLQPVADGRLKVKLERVRLGRLAVPQALVHSQLRRLAYDLENAALDENGSGVMALASGASQLGQSLLRAAMEDEPVDPVIRVQGRRWRIHDVRIDPQQIVLSLQPIP